MYQDKLKINDDNIEFLIIGSRQQLVKISPCKVSVGTTSDIKPVSEVHNLGSWFDSISPCQPIFSSLVAWHFSGSTILHE